MSSKAQEAQIKVNRVQNNPNFTLDLIEKQLIIFRKGLFSKTLNPPKDNLKDPNNYRTVTIKCLYKHCK
jgi:hypothetical protein